jgi:hypothetical protein
MTAVTSRETASAAALYAAGHTIRCIAELTGWPWSTVRGRLAAVGVPRRPQGSRCTADHHPGG